jgi:antagonist of KipI
MTPVFEVLKPGLLTTVQDLGRTGGQAHGIGVSGAMDAFALQVGNLLVGNARGDAALEVAMGGLRVRCLEDRLVAVCGADPGALADGRPVPAWKSVRVRKGQEIVFSFPRAGVWSYLAVEGGIAVEAVLGSKSTDSRAGLGGFKGRALAAGDAVEAGAPAGAGEGRALAAANVPDYASPATVGVIPGPQEEMFPEDAVRAFFSNPYEVTSQSDRMGYRLRGPALRPRDRADILSEAVAFGSIQVPADGQPIVLMADRQTTGGYAKIATVISTDLPRVAQVRPGGKLAFRAVELGWAQDRAAERERFLEAFRAGVSP